MACRYTINLNIPGEQGRQLILPSYSQSGDNFSWEGFIKDLLENSINKTSFQDLVIDGANKLLEYKQKLAKDPNLTIPSINITDSLYVIKSNLQTLGVKMNIVENDKMDQEFGQQTNAAVKNGEVYIRRGVNGSIAMHELLHLVFAVMRASDPERYVQIMDKLSNSQAVITELNSLPSSYSDLLPSEQIEEALMRTVEKLLDKQIDANTTIVQIGQTQQSLWDFLNEYIKEDIKKTFGLSNVPSVALFLQSKLEQLPLQGNNWFIKDKIKTNGYGVKKQQAILGSRVLNFIRQLSSGKNPEIQKECLK